jgi:hypothetical protein
MKTKVISSTGEATSAMIVALAVQECLCVGEAVHEREQAERTGQQPRDVDTLAEPPPAMATSARPLPIPPGMRCGLRRDVLTAPQDSPAGS